MKKSYCRSLLLLTCLMLIRTSLLAQDNRLKLHAVSLGVGIASTASESSETGLGLNFDFSTMVKSHIISFNSNIGTYIETERGEESFFELNLTYGRKWELGKKFAIEGHLGIGIFTFDEEIEDANFNFDFPGVTTGFPFRIKLLYYPIERFGISLNPNINFNEGFTAYTINLILQYNFN